MRKMVGTVLLLSMFVFGLLAPMLTWAGWGSPVTVTMIDVLDAGIYVSSSTNQGCGNGNTRSFMSSATPGYKEIYAALLAAFLSGKMVTLLLTQCNGEDSTFNRVQVR